MTRIVTRLLLAGSGLLLGAIGGAMLTRTEAFLAMSDIRFDPNPSLLSELKAPSVLLILAGVAMLIGSIRRRLADRGLVIGALIYGSYGVARLFGMVLDGIPNGPMLVATLMELSLAGLLIGFRLASSGMGHPRTRAQGAP